MFYITSVDLDKDSAQKHQINSMFDAFNSVYEESVTLIEVGRKQRAFPKPVRQLLLIVRMLIKRRRLVFTRESPLALALFILGFRVVLELHQPPRYKILSMIRRLKGFNRFNVICISEGLSAWLDSNELKDVPVFHDGVSPIEKGPDYTFRDGFLYTGSLSKGEDAIRVAQLAEYYVDSQFVIVGGNREEVNRFKEQFPYPNLCILARMDNVVVRGLQKGALGLLMPLTPSNQLNPYTSPLKLFEYLESGRPVYCSSQGSLGQLKVLKNIVFLVSDEDFINEFEGFRRQISSGKGDEMAARAKAYVMNNHTWEIRAKNILYFVLKKNVK